MIENPLHEQLAAAGDLSPADFAAALAACPVSPAEDQDLIPLGDFAPDEYQLLPAAGFTLDAAGIFPGAGFYMIEEEAGRKAYRFAGGAAFSQILLPVTQLLKQNHSEQHSHQNDPMHVRHQLLD